MQTSILDERKPFGLIRLFKDNPVPSVRPFGRQAVLGCLTFCILILVVGPTAFAAGFRYSASSIGGPRIYITNGTAMLSEVKAALPKAGLVQVAPGIWHLRDNLFLENGATLLLHGTKIGGDCNELRLKSNNTGATNDIISITADWGNLDIRSTRITSWDDAADGPDTEFNTFRRSFIRVRSSLDPDGVTPHEARMDIIDSDVGYLGSHHAEAYGLVWKVIGVPSHELFEKVNVYGDIKNSRVHHNFFGHYSWGSQGQVMLNNEIDHNVWYGFDPHDDSDALVIENNNVHHNGTHGIIGSQRCDHMIIRNNITWNNGGNGIMLHRYTDFTLVENNLCLNNGDSGIAVFDSRNNTIRRNTCWNNFKSGIRLSVGAADNLIEENEFAFGENFGLYLYKGGDAPFPGDDGRPKRNRFINNLVYNNSGNGLFLTSADNNVFAQNVFEANYGPLWLINGRFNLLESNTIPRDVIARSQGSPNMPSISLIRNQSPISVQVDAYSSVVLDDADGRVFDPEEGGIPTTVAPDGNLITLTMAEIAKTSTILTRSLYVVPDAGVALITVSIWNTSGDLGKRWFVQAGSSTRTISYKIGDLSPNRSYQVFKNGEVEWILTSNDTGIITFQETAVATGVVEYMVKAL